ncbi:MAG: hypothetical protein PQJ61_09595 [Spirochaetales bacterium]|uniref:Uncharacterized protein n=1 Tax=Candidatus Thalassospirochaeta sargassi TaxID=3119039 RepID=A0AAJ1IF65_9SPIO|nr:hypothetical protein [Spirochaetales bacterium]
MISIKWEEIKTIDHSKYRDFERFRNFTLAEYEKVKKGYVNNEWVLDWSNDKLNCIKKTGEIIYEIKFTHDENTVHIETTDVKVKYEEDKTVLNNDKEYHHSLIHDLFGYLLMFKGKIKFTEVENMVKFFKKFVLLYRGQKILKVTDLMKVSKEITWKYQINGIAFSEPINLNGYISDETNEIMFTAEYHLL